MIATVSTGLADCHQVDVEKLEVRLARLPYELDDLKVAHLSDFHYASERDAEVIRKAVCLINELHPDVIFLTGDYVTFPNHLAAVPCAQILSELHAPMGVFAVLGNHDQCNPQFISRALEGHGIAVLSNNALHVDRHGARLWIAGVDDVLDGQPNLAESLSEIPNGEATVLLVHEPDFADSARSFPVDLQLSGHSHGGQIRVPLIGAPYLPPLAHKYPSGLLQLGGLSLYTTRGIGTTFLPLRLNCPPEVTLLTLRSKFLKPSIGPVRDSIPR
jgi:predicted MPP superfamily phosphohydrolase